jgi:hypothetical protein
MANVHPQPSGCNPERAENNDFSGAADPIRLTAFGDRFASARLPIDFPSLDKLVGDLRATLAPTKDQLPLIKLARFSGQRSANGSLRHDVAIVELWGAEGDYDSGLLPIEAAVGKIQAAGIETLLYETPSSTPERPRWRVLCFTSREYTGTTDELRELRARWVARINGVLGGVLADESFRLSQAFYIGRVENKPPIKVITTAGTRIDLRDDLDDGAIFKNGHTTPTAKAPTIRTQPHILENDPTLSDDDPRLLQECERRVEGFRRKKGIGSTPAGERAHQLVQWLADIGTHDGLTPSARMIERVIRRDYPETNTTIIEDMLSRRKDQRGWDIIDPIEPEPDRVDRAAEPIPVPAPLRADEAKRKLEEEVRKVLEHWRPTKRLIKGAMGLGKTDTVLRLIAERAEPKPENDEGQIIYAAQRHALLQDAAETLRGYLRANGWSEEAIAENIVILQSRHHVGRDKDGNEVPPLCLKHDEAEKLSGHGGSLSESLCRRPATKKRPEVRCEHFETCPFQNMKRQSARARFVFMTHSHLSSPWPPAGAAGTFHPRNARLFIIDENPTSALFDQEPTRIKAGAFKELVPEIGEKIEEALARTDTLDFLREAGVTADQIYIAAEARKKSEKRRRIGHPGMSADERSAAIEQIKQAPPPPQLSRWLTCLADEVKSDRPGECHSLRRDSGTGDILARARKPLWDTIGQKCLVLDGTAHIEDLRCVLPKTQEVGIEVPRNAIFVQVTTNTYSKNTTLKDGKPTQLLKDACEFIEIFAKAFPDKVAMFTTKEIRRGLTRAKKGEKLDVYTPFRGARLGHYRNVRGSNAFENCEIGFLVGRAEDPVEVIEGDARAWHYDAPTPLKFLKPEGDEAKRLENRSGWYTMKDGQRVISRFTRHPDQHCQRRNETTREDEMLQAIDRLRLIHNKEPKLVFILSSLPLPIPVDVLISEDTIAKIVGFRDILAGIETAGLGGAAPITGTFLSQTWPEVWPNPKAGEDFLREIFPKQDQWVRESLLSPAEPNSTYLIRFSRSQEALKIFLLRQVLRTGGWNLARFQVAGTKAAEWSLFIHRDGSTAREALAAHLKVALTSLNLSTLTGEPLDVEGETASTGDALLDQALGICATAGMALSFDPKALAALPGSPWKDPKAAKNWKEGDAAGKILQRGPPEVWSRVEYRLASRRGGRASVAWVPEAVDPSLAISEALGVKEAEIVICGAPHQPWEPAAPEDPWEVVRLSPAAPLGEPSAPINLRRVKPAHGGSHERHHS